jgi:hypothetical protein
MTEYYFSVNQDDNISLCVAPLTGRRLAASGQDIRDTRGYFLFEQHGEGDNARIEILAQAVSADAALKLRVLLGME